MLQYADKFFVRKPRDRQYLHSILQQIWEGVCGNDKKAVYRLIVTHEIDVNAVYDHACCSSSLTLAKVMLLQENGSLERCPSVDRSSTIPSNMVGTSGGQTLEDLDGCSLLHLACENADIAMLELLLQYGASVNSTDSKGQTPLHRCITKGKSTFVKFLLAR